MSKAIPAPHEQDQDQTRFCAADLAIRNRVMAYKAALDATADAAPLKDELLAGFCREVENLQSQLGQVEAQFGKNSPMAQVLREALESAQCRKATRRIELGMDEKEKKPSPVEQMAPKPDKDHGLGWGWALIALVALDDPYRRRMQQQQQALAFVPAATR